MILINKILKYKVETGDENIIEHLRPMGYNQTV